MLASVVVVRAAPAFEFVVSTIVTPARAGFMTSGEGASVIYNDMQVQEGRSLSFVGSGHPIVKILPDFSIVAPIQRVFQARVGHLILQALVTRGYDWIDNIVSIGVGAYWRFCVPPVKNDVYFLDNGWCAAMIKEVVEYSWILRVFDFCVFYTTTTSYKDVRALNVNYSSFGEVGLPFYGPPLQATHDDQQQGKDSDGIVSGRCDPSYCAYPGPRNEGLWLARGLLGFGLVASCFGYNLSIVTRPRWLLVHHRFCKLLGRLGLPGPSEATRALAPEVRRTAPANRAGQDLSGGDCFGPSYHPATELVSWHNA